MVETLLLVQTVLYILGLGGLVYWLTRQIRALQGTLDAQAETIKAQGEMLTSFETLVRTIQGVLESTDEPKMLARLKAYKEFVDREKETALQDQARQFSEEKEKMSQAQLESLELLNSVALGYIDFAGKLLPYVPLEERKKRIDELDLPGSIKKRLYRMAETAPDLSARRESPYARLLRFPPPREEGTIPEVLKRLGAQVKPEDRSIPE